MNLRTPSNARTALTVAIFAALAGQTQPIGAQVASAEELQGLWHASQYFPAEIHGTLLLLREKGGVVADVAGYRVPVMVSEERMSFRLPGSRGEFRGMKVNGEREIRGFWLQPVAPGPCRAFATNVTLRPFGREGWSGKLEPLNDSATFFLPITSTADATIRTYLRDPERNRGVFTNVHRVTRAGDVVRLLGVRRGEKAETALFEGLYKNGRLVFHPSTTERAMTLKKCWMSPPSPFSPAAILLPGTATRNRWH
jgi:hypothetical protein